jgi:two-component system, NarL family, response regulator LiaR
MTIRVLIVDDHGIVRQGLRMYLKTDPGLEVVGDASDGLEAVELARELHPDVVLMDLIMSGMDGISATRIIRSEMPEVEIVALTSVLEDASVVEAVRAGATGYLLKDTSVEELCRAIRAAAAGQVQLAPAAAARLMAAVVAPPSTEQLTPRELDVLRLLALGKSNAEIGLELRISEQTVKSHVSHILSKLNLSCRTQAALHAIRIGLVQANNSVGGEGPKLASTPTRQTPAR